MTNFLNLSNVEGDVEDTDRRNIITNVATSSRVEQVLSSHVIEVIISSLFAQSMTFCNFILANRPTAHRRSEIYLCSTEADRQSFGKERIAAKCKRGHI